ncbi:MAG: DUF1015 domain-containing protein [Gemmatimonadota bacterium]|jgi:hypothetical protein|nr:DUF1015 domain-containing protein [Gemmatimonadota bacterium]
MSRRETPMTLWYWSQTGGLLLEEFMVVRKSPGQERRLVDGLIVLGEEARRSSRGERFDIRDRDVIVVQTKTGRLGMYLMGQTLFSLQLVKDPGVRSVQSVALCAATDARLQPMLEAYPGCRVVVCPTDARVPMENGNEADLGVISEVA